MKHGSMNTKKLWKKVVKREGRCIFVQVIEKVEKINLKKCPKHPLQYDIMGL